MKRTKDYIWTACDWAIQGRPGQVGWLGHWENRLTATTGRRRSELRLYDEDLFAQTHRQHL